MSTTPPVPAKKHTGAIEIRLVGWHPKDGSTTSYKHTITEDDFRKMSFFDFTEMVVRRISEGAAALRKEDDRVCVESLEAVETNG